MIRLIQRRLIIPRGDTGSFSIPVLKDIADNIAVFTIFDEVSHTKILQKKVKSEGGLINIAFTHADTVNLKPGEYVWDIKYYSNPEYIDDELVNGEEIDSYYAGFSLPVCEIRETADNYLVSPEGPTATLSPEQLEIVTGAIHSLNEAIRKTQENVEHYPEIRDEVWYVWDAELGDYVSTDVRANGIVGNGIASAVLNDDYTLTLNFTDGTSFTSPSIRGQRGNGIEDIVLNNDFTLTITYTDGESYVTPSIRGPVGATPQFSIGTVQDGAVAAASITGTAENPVLNLTLPNAHVPTRVSQLENDSNYAVDANYVHTDNNYTTAEKEKLSGIAAGAEVNVNADWNANSGDAQILNKPTKVSAFTNDAGYLTEHQDISGKADKSEIPTKVSQLQNDSGYLTSYTETDPTVPAWAKVAQKPSYTAAEVGAPTVAEMNTAIETAIGQINSFDMAVVQTLPTQDISTHTIYLVPKTGETNDVYDEYVYINDNWEMVGNTQIDLSNYATKDELPDVPVQDVQIDGTSILNAQGVAAIPIASANVPGVVEVNSIDSGIGFMQTIVDGQLVTTQKICIMPASNGQIKVMSGSFAPITADKINRATFYGLAKAAGDSTQSASSNAVGNYTDDAKTAIQQMLDVPSNSDIPTQVSELTNDAGYLTTETDPTVPQWAKAATKPSYTAAEVGALPSDTHIPSTTAELTNDAEFITVEDIPEVPVQDVQVNGTSILSGGVANIVKATAAQVKAGTETGKILVPSIQDASAFFGLAKAAGDTTQSESDNAVGAYTDAAKAAIRQMLGIPNFEWELIADVTVTEDSEVVTVNTDIGGQPFSLSRMYVRTSLPKTTTGTQDYVKSRIINTRNNGYIGNNDSPTVRYTGATSNAFIDYDIEIISGFYRVMARIGSAYNNSQSVVQLSYAGLGESLEYLVSELNGFKLEQYNSTSTLIPAGTKIAIYGIRI